MKKILVIVLLGLSLAACKAQPQAFVKVKSAKADRVQIESAHLLKPGYIVIREVGSGDQLGPIIGQSILYPIGTQTNVVIAVATLRSGQQYVATIREENGDFTFTEKLDPAAKNSKGQDISTTFTAQ